MEKQGQRCLREKCFKWLPGFLLTVDAFYTMCYWFQAYRIGLVYLETCNFSFLTDIWALNLLGWQIVVLKVLKPCFYFTAVFLSQSEISLHNLELHACLCNPTRHMEGMYSAPTHHPFISSQKKTVWRRRRLPDRIPCSARSCFCLCCGVFSRTSGLKWHGKFQMRWQMWGAGGALWTSGLEM